MNKEKELRDVVDWMFYHISSATGMRPDKQIIEIFKKNNWLYDGKIYRGLHWGSYYAPFDSPFGRFKLGQEIEERKDYSSWTKNKNVAASFAASGAHDSWIISENEYFKSLDARVCKKIKRDGGAGIILSTKTSYSMDVQLARNTIENFGGEISAYIDRRLPGLYEAEVLVLHQIRSKIIKHFHPKLCKEV